MQSQKINSAVTQNQIVNLLIGLSVVEGIITTGLIMSSKSEQASGVILGLSPARLLMVLISLVVTMLFFLLLVRNKRNSDYLITRLHQSKLRFLLTGLIVVVLSSVTLTFLTSISPSQQSDATVANIVRRVWPLMAWTWLLAVQFIVILVKSSDPNEEGKPLRLAIYFALFMAVNYVFMAYYDAISWHIKMRGLLLILSIPVISGFMWAVLPGKHKEGQKALSFWLSCLFIGTVTFAFYRSLGFLMGRFDTPSKAYWDVLADAFNHGRLYLLNPPITHDLTFYNGHWFVPNPPFPAVLLMPIVAVAGVNSVNMTVVSAILGALNAVFMYALLEAASSKEMIMTSRNANLWITAAFAIGTNHVWLATIGQMWFVSHLVTVMMIAIAALIAVQNGPVWLQGLFFGFALLTRPNVFPMALFLFGIFLWQQQEFPKVPWKKAMQWMLAFGGPAVVCAFLLILYNKLRFDDWFDFGYVTINGADWIMDSVRTYGMFHPHFFRHNFEVMFLKIPRIITDGSDFFFQPGYEGFSIFFMSPFLLWSFRRFHRNWWQIGAWAGVLLTLFLLLFYHNTGSEQVGYRYLMDAIVPLMLLVATGFKREITPLFRLVVIFAAVINLLSVYWWYIGRAL